MINCISPFLSMASQTPSLPAFKGDGVSVTYGDFEKEVRKTAAYFISKGIRKGDRILILVPMSVDLYRNVLALFYIGAVAVFLDQWVTLKRFRLCCTLADCKGIVLNGKFRLLSWLFPETRNIPLKLSPSGRSKMNSNGSERMNPEDPALITFTTGSTGVPKAAERSHGFLLKQLNAVSEELNANPGETEFTNLPIVLLCNLANGTSSFLEKIKSGKIPDKKADRFLRNIVKNRVNRITGSPYFILKLAERAQINARQFPELKYVLTGGGPVFPNDAIALMDAFPGAKIKVIYGSTEAEPIAVIDAAILSQQIIGSVNDGLLVGYPVADIKVKILKLRDYPHEMTGEELVGSLCGTGEAGEIIVSGPHVLDRYFRNERAFSENKIISDNTVWHRTGDAGFFDNAGLLYLCGRAINIFNSVGKMISPFIAEYRLKQIHGIEAGTVIKTGNDVVLFLELSSDNDNSYLDEIHKIIPGITKVRIIKQMPRDPRHFTKIDYEKLRALPAVASRKLEF